MARTWRLHHPGFLGTAGASFALGEQEAHHVRRVLRLAPGERVAVFDGAGSEWSAVIETSDREGVRLRLEAPVAGRVEPTLEVVLFQALCKSERMEWLLQKATEIGVSEIRPFPSERSGQQRVTDHRLTRWRRVVVEAAKQSGRRVVPKIEVHDALPREPPTLGLLLDPRPEAAPLGRLCGATERPQGVWVAVGPESGFETHEMDSWCASGWRPARMGPRVLRADTAGVVAATILLHWWGDLGSGSAPAGNVDSVPPDA